MVSTPVKRTDIPLPGWMKAVALVLSALFFISGMFVILSPAPLLILYFWSGRRWAWMAAFTNSIIVAVALGSLGFAIYLVLAVTVALGLGEFIRRKTSLEKSAVFGLVLILGVGAAVVAAYSNLHHLNPWLELKNDVSSAVDYVAQSSVQNGGTALTPEDLQDWKQGVTTELPSILGVFSLILIWANLMILMRVNPGQTRERLGLDATFTQKWKAPEFLVWPTILMGFFVLVDVPRVSVVAVNLFKFLMAIYALQGLSILSFLFDRWKLQKFFKTVGFVIAVFLMLPLLLSLGFFDLWFDFRGKFRQS